MEKGPSSIWRRDMNSRPLEWESLPLTTRSGLPLLGSFDSDWTAVQMGTLKVYQDLQRVSAWAVCTAAVVVAKRG